MLRMRRRRGDPLAPTRLPEKTTAAAAMRRLRGGPLADRSGRFLVPAGPEGGADGRPRNGAGCAVRAAAGP